MAPEGQGTIIERFGVFRIIHGYAVYSGCWQIDSWQHCCWCNSCLMLGWSFRHILLR